MEIEEFQKLNVGDEVYDYKRRRYVIEKIGTDIVYVKGNNGRGISRFALLAKVESELAMATYKARMMPCISKKITISVDDIITYGHISATIMAYLRMIDDGTFYGSIRSLYNRMSVTVHYNSLVKNLDRLVMLGAITMTKLGPCLIKIKLCSETI